MNRDTATVEAFSGYGVKDQTSGKKFKIKY